MKNIYSCIIAFASFVFTIKANAQPAWFPQSAASGPYIENSDPHYNNWEKQTSQSDDFTGSLDMTKWDYWDRPPCTPWPGIGYNPSTANWVQPANVTVENDAQISNDVLRLNVDLCNPSPPNVCFIPGSSSTCYLYSSSYYYTVGGLQSKYANYGYGYYEANIKTPGWYFNGNPAGDGFWLAFWLHSEGICFKNEIDILEPGGSQFANANFNEAGFHDKKPICWATNCASGCGDCINGSNNTDHKVGRAQMTSSVPLFLDYHNYAVEFFSDKIIFYFDKVPYAWVAIAEDCQPNNTASIIKHALDLNGQPMYVAINNSISHMPGYNNNNGGTPMAGNPPSWGDHNTSMYVDYFYYWTLKQDCSTASIIYNNTDLSNFFFAVKKSIIFDGSASNINIPTTGQMNNLTFRATDEIDIKPGFEAPAGCTMNLIITPCN